MARTKNEEVVLTSEVAETITENKEDAVRGTTDNSPQKEKYPDVFTLEKELVEIGIKYANRMNEGEVPMNSQQIATLESLRNLYETLKK